MTAPERRVAHLLLQTQEIPRRLRRVRRVHHVDWLPSGALKKIETAITATIVNSSTAGLGDRRFGRAGSPYPPQGSPPSKRSAHQPLNRKAARGHRIAVTTVVTGTGRSNSRRTRCRGRMAVSNSGLASPPSLRMHQK